jgi:hypothetical protein
LLKGAPEGLAVIYSEAERGEGRLRLNSSVTNFAIVCAGRGWRSSTVKLGGEKGDKGGLDLSPILPQSVLGGVDSHLSLGWRRLGWNSFTHKDLSFGVSVWGYAGVEYFRCQFHKKTLVI